MPPFLFFAPSGLRVFAFNCFYVRTSFVLHLPFIRIDFNAEKSDIQYTRLCAILSVDFLALLAHLPGSIGSKIGI
jgi:hypothetical protein